MNEGTGIQWTLTKHLEDLDFVDDVYLISATHSQMQRKTEKLRVVTSVVRPSRVDENHLVIQGSERSSGVRVGAQVAG